MKSQTRKLLRFATLIQTSLFTLPVLAEETALYDNIPGILPSFDSTLYHEAGPPGIPDDQPFNAQHFKTGDRGNISSVGVYIINGGTASGSVKISLMDDEQGLPGKVIAELGEIELDSLPVWNDTNSIGEVVTLDAPVAGLSPNSRYYIALDNSAMVHPGDNFPSASYFNLHKPDGTGTREAEPTIVRPSGAWEPLSDYVAGANYMLLRIMESDLDGFIGHDVAFSGRYYDSDNEAPPGAPISLGSARVGIEVESVGRTIDLGGGATFSAATFDLDAYTIDIDMAHLAGNSTAPGNFNGYIIEDKNGTLPDFHAVTVDSASTTLFPDDILVSPNSIWIGIRGITIPADASMRLNVTFAGSRPSPIPSLTPQSNGSMILEAPAIIGESYQFEQSSDLLNFTPIDNELAAYSTFVATHLMPTGSQMFYRLRKVE